MNVEKILELVKKFDWKEEEAPASTYVIDLFCTCYLDANETFRTQLYSRLIYVVENQYAYEWIPKPEVENAWNWFQQMQKINPDFFQPIEKDFLNYYTEIAQIAEKIYAESLTYTSNAQIVELIDQLYVVGRKQYGIAIITEVADLFSEADLLQRISKTDVKKAKEALAILTFPIQLTASESEKLELLRIARDVLKAHGNTSLTSKKTVVANPHFKEVIDALKNNYFWILNSFKQSVELDSNHFVDKIIELTHSNSLEELESKIMELQEKTQRSMKKIAEIEKQFNLSPESKQLFEMVRGFSLMQDRRKQCVQRIVYAFDCIHTEAEKRFGVPKKELVNYYIGQLKDLFLNGKPVSSAQVKGQETILFFSSAEKGKIQTIRLTGNSAVEVRNYFLEHRNSHSQKQLSGFVASLGNGLNQIEGIANVVLDPQYHHFVPGQILVAGMTRPEYVPLMKKALAIVTNEGGITSHAAIVSRELNVPCIIGTKVATDRIKSGNKIRLDLQNGTIDILD